MSESNFPKVIVVIEDLRHALRSSALELLTWGNALGEVTVLTCSEVGDQEAIELQEFGVSKVLRASNVPAENWSLAGVASDVIVSAVKLVGANAVLLNSTFPNKEAAARAGFLLSAGVIIDAASLRFDEDFHLVSDKRVFAGTWDIICRTKTAISLATVRANSIIATRPAAPAAQLVVSDFEVVAQNDWSAVTLVSRSEHQHDSSKPVLAEAPFVVAGGRGTLGDFSGVKRLAEVLGGAYGATRDAVDEGWVDHDAQIGQTGVTIAPRVYIGAGISGAPHHRGGMQAAQVIIAINNDAEAPLVEISDFVVVGDANEILHQAAEYLLENWKK